MSLVHTTTIRNSLANLVVDAIDAGTGAAAGKLIIATTGFALTLAQIIFPNPAFGNASAGTAAVSSTPLEDSSADATGTAAVWMIQNRDGVEVVRGSVTATGGGGDIELSSVAISAGDAVRLNSLTYSAAP